MDEVFQFLIRHGYTVLFVWVFAEQIGVPLPAAPILLAAGVLAGGFDAWRERAYPVENKS